MSRVDGAGRAAQTAEQAGQLNERGGLPPGVEATGMPAAAGQPGQLIAKGPVPLGPDGKPLSDGLAAEAQAKVPNAGVIDQGLQNATAGNPFQNINLVRAQQMMSEAPRLTQNLVDLDSELTMPDEALGKLLGLERKALLKGGKFSQHQSKLLQTGDRLREASMLMVSDALTIGGEGEADLHKSGGTKMILAENVRHNVAVGRLQNAKAMKNAMFAHRAAFPLGMDVHAFVKAVLREAYMLQNEELLDRGRKMKALNERKKELKKSLRRAKELKLAALNGDKDALADLSGLLGFEIAEAAEDSMPEIPDNEEGGDPENSSGGSSTELTFNWSAEAREYLDQPIDAARPPLDLDSFADKLTGEQNQNAARILEWILRNGSFDRLLDAASTLEPEAFRQVLRGLLNLKRHADAKNLDNVDNLYDDYDWADEGDTEHALENMAKANKSRFDGWINKLLANATPDQLLHVESEGYGGLGTELSKIESDMDARFFQPARNIRTQVAGEPAAAVLTLFYMSQRASSSSDAFKERFRYELSQAPDDTILSVLQKIGPEMLENGEGDELKRVFQALPPRIFDTEANLDQLLWLKEAFEPAPDEDGSTGENGAGETSTTGGEDHRSRPQFETNTYYNNLMSAEEKEEFIKTKIAEFEDESEQVGFDQQMMQMELQDLMQKQQQFLTMMSNMSKMMHDVAMSIIRNIGG